MDNLNKLIRKLTKLVEQSQDKRLLWEEMQQLSQKAFETQDMIMDELDKIEATETDVVKVQAAFSAREGIWDLMRQITDREQAIKEKTHTKETPAERNRRHKEIMADARRKEHTCTCGHHHDGACCRHDGDCSHTHTNRKRKTCRKK